MGTVLRADMSYYGKRRTFELAIGDETGTLVAKWFNFNPRFMKGRFRKGMRLILSGRGPALPISERDPSPRVGNNRGRRADAPGRNPDRSPGKGRISPFRSNCPRLFGDRGALSAAAVDPPDHEKRCRPLCPKGLQRNSGGGLPAAEVDPLIRSLSESPLSRCGRQHHPA